MAQEPQDNIQEPNMAQEPEMNQEPEVEVIAPDVEAADREALGKPDPSIEEQEVTIKDTLLDRGMTEDEAERWMAADREAKRQAGLDREQPVLEHSEEERIKGQARKAWENFGEGKEELSPEAQREFAEMEKQVDDVPLPYMEQEELAEVDRSNPFTVLQRETEWQSQLDYVTNPSPNGFLERILKNEEYEKQLFNKTGRVHNFEQWLNKIVSNNYAAALASGDDFDAITKTETFLAKLYIDISAKLGKDVSQLDYRNEDLRDFLMTDEGMTEIQNGLGLVRAWKKGFIHQRKGETIREKYKRISNFGVFDGTGRPSMYRSGASKEEREAADDDVSPFFKYNIAYQGGKAVMGFLRDSTHYGLHRLGKAFDLNILPNDPRYTPLGAQMLGTVAPYITTALMAYRTANAMTGNRAIAAMWAEIGGIAGDLAFTVGGEENLANMIDNWSDGGAWSTLIGDLGVEEGEEIWSSKLKEAVIGGLVTGTLASVVMAGKFGVRSADAFWRDIESSDPSTTLGKWWNQAELKAKQREGSNIVNFHSGIDLRSMLDGLPSLVKTLRESALSARQVKDILKDNDVALKAQARKEGVDLDNLESMKKEAMERGDDPLGELSEGEVAGKRWRDMTGVERQEFLQERSQVYRDARAWLDSRMRSLDIQAKIDEAKKGGQSQVEFDKKIQTVEDLENLLKVTKASEETRKARVESLYEIDMEDWKYQKIHGDEKENLAEFLQRNDFDANLPEDQVLRIRETRAAAQKAREDADSLFGNIKDQEARKAIRLKVEVGGKLTKEEEKMLNEATGLFTKSQLDKLEDEIILLKSGGLSASDRELFKHSKRFKSWLNKLKDKELKQEILDAVASGRELSDSAAAALTQVGFRDIYDGLRRSGALAVDDSKLIKQLEQLDDIDASIKEMLEREDIKKAKELENLERQIKNKAKELDKLEEIIEGGGQLTPAQKARKNTAKKGLDRAKKDAEDLRKKIQDTPFGRLEELEKKASRAKSTKKKLDDKFREYDRELTAKEKKQKLKASEALSKADQELKNIRKQIAETDNAQLQKLLKQRDNRMKKVVEMNKTLKEERARKLTSQQETQKAEATLELERINDEIKSLRKDLEETADGQLRKLLRQAKSAKKRRDSWEERVKNGEKLSPKQEELRINSQKKLDNLNDEIEDYAEAYKGTAAAQLKKLTAQVRGAETRKENLQEKIKVASSLKTQDEIKELEQTYKELEKKLSSGEGKLDEFEKHKQAKSLAMVRDVLDRVKRQQEAFDDATGEVDPFRLAVGELYYALKRYDMNRNEDTGALVEQAFYKLQQYRVSDDYVTRNGADIRLDSKGRVSQMAKITRGTNVLGKQSAYEDLEKLRTWSFNNRAQGNWRAEDIAQIMAGFNSRGKTWANKETSEKFMRWIDNDRNPFYRGNILRPAFSGYGLPVWLQGAKLSRIAGYVSGTGTSWLAMAFGVAETAVRGASRGIVSGANRALVKIGLGSKEMAEYSRLVRELDKQAKGDIGWGKRMFGSYGGVSRTIGHPFRVIFTPSKRLTEPLAPDVVGEGSEFVGERAGLVSREFSHLGKEFDTSSMTMLGVRAQNIQNPVAREIATAAVGLLEVMPREVMGTVDRWIKAATFDKTLRESVVDTLYRTTVRKGVKKGGSKVDIELAARMTDAIRKIELDLIDGKISENGIRTALGKEMGVDEFGQEVKLAVMARDQAWELQRELTLQQRVANGLQFLQKTSRHPAGGHFIMFGKTTANTTTMFAERVPFFGYLLEAKRGKLATPKGRLDTWAKQLVGTLVVGSGAAAANFWRDRITVDKHGDLKIRVNLSVEQQREALETIFEHEPSRLGALMNDYNKLNPKNPYSLVDDRDKFINEELVGGEGYINAKRFGHAWALFTLGVRAHWLSQGIMQNMPKDAADEVGLADHFNDIFLVLSNSFGVQELASGYDDMLSMIENPEDALTVMAFMLSDALSPMKALYSSRGEPLNASNTLKANRQIMDLETALTPEWLQNIMGGRKIVKRDALFMPEFKGDRKYMLADVDVYPTDFEVEMERMNIYFNQIRPNQIPLMGSLNTYKYKASIDEEFVKEWKKQNPDKEFPIEEGQSLYDFVQQLAGTIESKNGLSISAEFAKEMETPSYKAANEVLEQAVKIVNEIGYDEENPEHVKIISAANDAKQSIRSTVSKLRKSALEAASRQVIEKYGSIFRNDDDESLAETRQMLIDYEQDKENFKKEAFSAAKAGGEKWQAFIEGDKE